MIIKIGLKLECRRYIIIYILSGNRINKILGGIMSRDKARDDKYFNCQEEYELEYVSNLYGNNRERVYHFLKNKCNLGEIKYNTHKEVYKMIEKELGYKIVN